MADDDDTKTDPPAKSTEDVSGLKNALSAERNRAAKAERELATLRRQQEDAANASKSMEQRMDALMKRVEESDLRALRLEVAQSKGLSAKQAARLTGKTREELAADADDMIQTFGIKANGSKKDEEQNSAGDGKDDTKTEGASGGSGESGKRTRPKEDLKSGASTTGDGTETDNRSPHELADAVLKQSRGW